MTMWSYHMENESVADGVEALHSYVSGHDDVAYAEIAGLVSERTDAVVTAQEVRHATDVETSSIWFRLFVNGAADYRHTTVLDPNHLVDTADRAIRAARNLAQETPARYDPHTVHQAAHRGWARPGDSLESLSADAVGATVQSALGAHDFGDVEQVRVTYRDEHREQTFTTTTGTTLRTTVDRASTETAVDLFDGRRISDHAGATTGPQFLSSVPDRLSTLANRTRRLSKRATTRPDTGVRDVVLGPRAAGQLFHALGHYFEADMAFFGSSPLERGQQVGPPSLSVADTVPPGSWTAMAYDAEGRPAQPVTLVEDGEVVTLLHDTVSAADTDEFPHGHVVPALGHERPPRIHARHLAVEPGAEPTPALQDGASLRVDRLGDPAFVHEATQSKRASSMPPSVQYAKDVAAGTPDAYADESDNQRIEFPVEIGYELVDGSRGDAVVDTTLEVALADFVDIDGLGQARETVTGTCVKHESRLPVAVTAPAVRLPCTIR